MPIRSLATARRLTAADAEAARARLRALARPPTHDQPQSAAVEEPPVPSPARSPTSWRPLEMGRSAALGLIVLGAAVVAVTALVLLHRRPVPVQSTPVRSVQTGTTTVTPSPRPALTVDVAGHVRRPGVVRLPAGSRVADALRAVGGPRRPTDVGLLNLAAPLVDGEQIVVGTPGATAAAAASAGATGTDPSGLIDLNTATDSDLDDLPGIGPVLAQNILDYRAAHNGFHSVEELQQVDGIGPAKFGEIKDRVRV